MYNFARATNAMLPTRGAEQPLQACTLLYFSTPLWLVTVTVVVLQETLVPGNGVLRGVGPGRHPGARGTRALQKSG